MESAITIGNINTYTYIKLPESAIDCRSNLLFQTYTGDFTAEDIFTIFDVLQSKEIKKSTVKKEAKILNPYTTTCHEICFGKVSSFDILDLIYAINKSNNFDEMRFLYSEKYKKSDRLLCRKMILSDADTYCITTQIIVSDETKKEIKEKLPSLDDNFIESCSKFQNLSFDYSTMFYLSNIRINLDELSAKINEFKANSRKRGRYFLR